MLTVSLNDVRFYAFHGLFEHERKTGNEFAVDLDVSYSMSGRLSPENVDEFLAATISYVDLYEIVKAEMDHPRALLEAVSIAIVEKVRISYPFVRKIVCTVTKISPPISNFKGDASVTYEYP